MRSRDGCHPCAFQRDEVRDEHRRAGLVVGRASAVEPSVALDERPGIERPVLAPRGHDVEVRHQQNSARARLSSPKARHHVGDVPSDVTICTSSFGKPAFSEPGGDRLRRARRAVGPGRRNLDELFQDLARQRAIGAGGCCARRLAAQHDDRHRASANVFIMVAATVPSCCAWASESMFTQISLIFPFSMRKMSIPLTSIFRVPCVPRMTHRVATLLPSASSSSSVKCRSGKAVLRRCDELAKVVDPFHHSGWIAKDDVRRHERINRRRTALVENLVEIPPGNRLVVDAHRRLRRRDKRQQHDDERQGGFHQAHDLTSASFSAPASWRRRPAAASQDASSASRTPFPQATSRARGAATLPNDLPRR